MAMDEGIRAVTAIERAAFGWPCLDQQARPPSVILIIITNPAPSLPFPHTHNHTQPLPALPTTTASMDVAAASARYVVV